MTGIKSANPEASTALNGTVKLAYTVSELCQVVGVSRATVYKEIKGERLHIRKVGKRTLIPVEEVRAWLKL